MHTNLIKLFIVSVLFFSCSSIAVEDEVTPVGILTDQQMVTILTDAYLSEGASGINVKNVPGEKYDSTYMFNPLIDNHISKSRFDSSITYYAKHPIKLKAIYDKVLDKLSVAQAKCKLE